jgi:NAD(P)-dependent dehydrogenase (short-subunit alcohol dehydrogenase family)
VTRRWLAEDIPDQSGRVAVVTGGNSGLGAAVAGQLARHGAEVIIACRDTAKGGALAKAILAVSAKGSARVARLDLGELASIHAFAREFALGHRRLDLLVNNAGVMAPPRRMTKDGFELQFGTNHLGHFALTGLLLPLLLASPSPRVVTVSSQAHRGGWINFDDLAGQRHYNRWVAYGQSKLANLMFALELDRRSRQAGLNLRSYAAHPGWSATNLQSAGPALPHERAFMAVVNRLYAQSADMGALPVLYAATFPDLAGGSFVGPDGLGEGRGHPKLVHGSSRAHDGAVASRLWMVSEELTGVSFDMANLLKAP